MADVDEFLASVLPPLTEADIPIDLAASEGPDYGGDDRFGQVDAREDSGNQRHNRAHPPLVAQPFACVGAPDLVERGLRFGCRMRVLE